MTEAEELALSHNAEQSLADKFPANAVIRKNVVPQICYILFTVHSSSWDDDEEPLFATTQRILFFCTVLNVTKTVKRSTVS